MIEHQQSVYSWQFLFVGAGIDAYAEAASIGIQPQWVASTYASSECVLDSLNAFSKAATCIRNCAAAETLDASWKSGVTEQGDTADKVVDVFAAIPLTNADIAMAVNSSSRGL